MRERYRKLYDRIMDSYRKRSIQMLITISFSVLSILGMALMGSALYGRFAASVREVAVEDSKKLMDQVCLGMESYIRNMMRISDTTYYAVIKKTDLAQETLGDKMNLLYEANKDSLISIACFTESGELIAAVPVDNMKKGTAVTEQQWFAAANSKIENLHFSIPHVQNLFEESSYRYYWVISLSRAVELNHAGETSRGILLVDMNFSGIEQIFDKVNSKTSGGYVYLMDSEGEIIYHPKQKLLNTNILNESNREAASHQDGSYVEDFEGDERVIIVKSVGYTGWKVVSVTPSSEFTMNTVQVRFFAVMLIIFFILVMLAANVLVSSRIATPIQKLEKSVKELEEEGNLAREIYIGGSYEIESLGHSIQSMVNQMRKLMDDIVVEQEAKRKSELDALQSQINPHFLYNTLDSIVWMVESERYEEAITMVTSLANLFRISLSKGRNIIPIRSELEHAQNYLSIQKLRYKNRFTVEMDIQPEILDCSTIKLIVQPLLENAIYYGTGDGDGEITVKGYVKDKDIYIEVSDDGLGMPPETVELLLTDNNRVRKKGSGIGLINVHQRIQLYFGAAYGLTIESEPDEGTTIRIHLPMVPYTEEIGREGLK